MKKIIFFLFALLFVIPFCFAGCTLQDEKQLNKYDIKLNFNASTYSAEAELNLIYVNNSDNALDYIMFHLYPNAFSKEANNVVCSAVNFNKVFPNGESFGGLTVLSVCVENISVEASYDDEAKMLLRVPLTTQLFPDEKIQISIRFDLLLPNANHRFGYGDNAINFANFYPIACVYESKNGFITNTYSSNGDPFYSDCADYNVSISYPKSFSLAGSGDNIVTIEQNNFKTTTIQSNKIRDFAFVLSQKFLVLTDNIDNVNINYYYYDDIEPAESLNTAKKALKTFSDLFGDYPYSSFTVVQTNFVFGGMEYPRLVMISDLVKDVDYDYVIVHETAHQWWYAVVGNDEYNEAWLDESLTEYSTALFFEKNPEYNISYKLLTEGAYLTYQNFIKAYKKIMGEIDTSMLRDLDQFDTEPEYVNNIYTRGVIMFDTLRSQIGDKKFFSCLRHYYKDMAFKNSTSADFISIFEKNSGVEMEGFFNSWLLGKVVFTQIE